MYPDKTVVLQLSYKFVYPVSDTPRYEICITYFLTYRGLKLFSRDTERASRCTGLFAPIVIDSTIG